MRFHRGLRRIWAAVVFPMIPLGALGQDLPKIDQICAAAGGQTTPAEEKRISEVLVDSAALSIVPLHAKILALTPPDTYGNLGSGFFTGPKATADNLHEALSLPKECTGNPVVEKLISTEQEKLKRRSTDTTALQTRLEQDVRILLASSVFRGILNERRSQLAGQRWAASLCDLASGSCGAGVAKAQADWRAGKIAEQPLEQVIERIEAEHFLLAVQLPFMRVALADQMFRAFKYNSPRDYERYKSLPFEGLQKALFQEIVSSDKRLTDFTRGRSDYEELVTLAYGEASRNFTTQVGALCKSSARDLARYDNLILPLLLAAQMDEKGGGSGDAARSVGAICRVRNSALAKEKKAQVLLLAGTIFVVGSTAVSLGSAGLLWAGVGGTTLAQVGTVSGIAAAVGGIGLTIYDFANYGSAERRALVSRGLFNIQLATMKQVEGDERTLAWTLFGMVTGGLAAPTDALAALKMVRTLRGASRAAEEVVETSAVVRQRPKRVSTRWREWCPAFSRFQEELALCGLSL